MSHTAACLLTTGLWLLTSFLAAAEPDPVFDLPKLLATPLNPRTTKSEEQDGIVTEELMFHSEMDGDKSVDIFAILAYPKGAKGLPTFIWNQGGRCGLPIDTTIHLASR